MSDHLLEETLKLIPESDAGELRRAFEPGRGGSIQSKLLEQCYQGLCSAYTAALRDRDTAVNYGRELAAHLAAQKREYEAVKRSQGSILARTWAAVGAWLSTLAGFERLVADLEQEIAANDAKAEEIQTRAGVLYKLRGVAGGMCGRESVGDLAYFPDWYAERVERERAEAAKSAEERARQWAESNRAADERNRREAEEAERRTRERLAEIDAMTPRELLDVAYDGKPPLALAEAFAWGSLDSHDRLLLMSAPARYGYDPLKARAIERLQLIGTSVSAGVS